MIMMTAKDYLERVRQQSLLLRQAEQELLDVKSDILTIHASSLSEKVSGSKASDIADKYIKLETYYSRVMKEWDVLIDMRIEAKALIAHVADKAQQTILLARYVNGRTWGAVATELHYKHSRRQLLREHKEALQSFAKVNADFLQSL